MRQTNRDNLAAYLPGADATVPNSVVRVLSEQNAAGAHLNLLYLDWLARQLLPDTAETEWLDRHGQIWLGGRKPATYAAGSLSVTGTAGVVLPIGTTFAATDATVYEATESVTLSARPTPIAVTAQTPGAIGNRDLGTTLAISVAIAGADASATVLQLTGGADPESDDDLRSRVLLRIRNPPMGGSATDYVQWALAVPGITRAWVAPLEMGVGTVTVRVMADQLRASNQGFPTQEDLAAVAAYIDARRPVTVAEFYVLPPKRYGLSITIRNLSRDTPSTRAAIEVALRAMLMERAAPGQTIYASWVAEAISAILGEDHHDLDFGNAVMPDAGTMAVLESIFYV
ncbi:baseplate J/gp47 family protein [Methylobacterium dankookense]|uniref:baseplate J/gp47 family protein n=1 Tax=Methylobacterium dankookense TaxID=560405 RepID=UPI0016438DFE|nr:baseplate J/gp47 family protein [Methylobacterium dankookense]